MANTATRVFTQTEIIENTFISKVYGWMAAGLGVTAVVAAVTASSPSLIHAIVSNSILFFGLVIGEFGLVMYLSARIEALTAETATRMFLAYAFLNGLTFSVLFLAYTMESIASTFLITSATFGTMSVYGYTTKKDLTSMGSIAFMGLIGIIIASVVNLFLHSSALYWLISCAGVLVFVGLTAYDTQKIKGLGQRLGQDSESLAKGAVIGALTLYLDFINLFLMFLRLLGNRRD